MLQGKIEDVLQWNSSICFCVRIEYLGGKFLEGILISQLHCSIVFIPAMAFSTMVQDVHLLRVLSLLSVPEVAVVAAVNRQWYEYGYYNDANGSPTSRSIADRDSSLGVRWRMTTCYGRTLSGVTFSGCQRTTFLGLC